MSDLAKGGSSGRLDFQIPADQRLPSDGAPKSFSGRVEFVERACPPKPYAERTGINGFKLGGMRVVIAIASLVMACGWAYSQSTHAFEVASIRQDPAPPPQLGVRGEDLRDDLTCDVGGRFVARRNSTQRLIMKAYNIQAFQVEGMPG